MVHVRAPAVLTALEEIRMDINTPPEGFDAMTPAALEVASNCHLIGWFGEASRSRLITSRTTLSRT